MENNTNTTTSAQVNSVPASTKGSFWKGVAVGAVGIIAIICIASIIFTAFAYSRIQPALDTAHVKANVAAARANLNNLRAQAEVHYDNNSGSYAGVCTSEFFDATLRNVSAMAIDGDVMCSASSKEYVVAATIQDVDGVRMACVDSTGASAFNMGQAKSHFAVGKMTCN